jgi:hypothetical protein
MTGMSSYIVCGWYTPDYAPYYNELFLSLEANRIPHDFVRVSPRQGSWEKCTLRKANEVFDAMTRHPDKTIIFLDVDCVVRAPLVPLVALPGDIGLCISGKADSKGRQKIRVRAGTMVIRPTPRAHEFVRLWLAKSQNAPRRATDQTTIAMAMHIHGLNVSVIGKEWCAIPADNLAKPKILHESASAALGLHGWRNWPILRPWRASRPGGRSSASDTSAGEAPCAGQR